MFYSLKYRLLCILLSACLLTGCYYALEYNNISLEQEEVYHELNSLEDIQIEETQYILVNQVGYRTDARKIAIFCADRPVEYFELVDKDTGKVVLRGETEEKGYDESSGEYRSYGIFDDLTREGEYYIQIPDQGYSNSFYIKDDIYNNIFLQTCKNYFDSHNQLTFTEEVQTMANILLAYELFEKIFLDNCGILESGNGIPDILDEVKYKADWLLTMQDSDTGGVYAKAVSANENVNTADPVTREATAVFAAIMSKFAYACEPFHEDYAKVCLEAAEKAWGFLEKESNSGEGQHFWAAAELYRASGKSVYKQAAEEYLLSEGYEKMNQTYYFWGCMTYIATERTVNISLCSKIMKTLMLEVEEISTSARKSIYLTSGNERQDDIEALLDQMIKLTVVDYVIANHEYETVIENHLHFFMGRNAAGINYMEDMDAYSNSKIIIMLSEILSRY